MYIFKAFTVIHSELDSEWRMQFLFFSLVLLNSSAGIK